MASRRFVLSLGSMTVPALVIGILLGLVLLFSIARFLFGPACAVLLAGVLGACFGGPPGAGVGLVIGLVLAPVTWLLFPSTEE